jgi:tetratricopeptide (TPR) repeat protein
MKATLHKILTTVFLAAFAATSAYAQNNKIMGKYGSTSADSLECVKNQSLYAGYYEQDNYDMAVGFWRQNFNECPASSTNIYVRGEKMFTHFYEQTKDRAFLDTIFMMQDRRAMYFGDKPTWDLRKAGFMNQFANNHPELTKESYNVLQPYVTENREDITNGIMITQMINTMNMYATGNIFEEEVINNYARLIEIADNKISSGKSVADFQNAKDLIEGFFKQSGVATCQNLIPLFTPKVNENPDDVGLLKKVISLLDNAQCTDSELYYTSVENLYKIEKSGNAAYHLAQMNVSKNNFPEAEKYFLEAVDLESDPMKKSNYLSMLGTFELANNNYVKATSYAKDAISHNPNNGTAHLIIGSAYAMAPFNGDDFENKTRFWIAVDYLNKAKTLDPQLADRANESITSCSANFPTKEEAFFVGIYEEGSPYTVKGWINERTTVRFKK